MKYKNNLLIGALTSKPYAFTARSWELKNIETIDLFDSLCSNIRIDIRSSEILRILPINNQYVNGEWISDKTRYAYDGLRRWRFINPMLKKENLFINCSWQEILLYLKNKINKISSNNIIINTGNFCDLETITTLDNFSNKLNNVIINSDINITGDKQNYFITLNDFNELLSHKIFIIVGINLRLQNPILNIKLRKLSQSNNVLIGFIGSKHDYNINLLHLGNNLLNLLKLVQGKHNFANIIFSFFKKENINYLYRNEISIIFGQESINQKNFYSVFTIIETFNINNIKFNFKYITSFTGKLNILELGFFNNKQKYLNNKFDNLFYLIGVEDCKNIKKTDFVIFQGHHNDKIRTKFDVILPTVNWTEKSSIYLNIFGNIQKTNFSIYPPVNTRLDWKITRMLSILYDKDICFNTIKEVHTRMNQISPNINSSILKYNKNNSYLIHFNKKFNKKFLINENPFKCYIPDYYRTQSIDRSSKVMKNCSNIFTNYKNNFYK